MVEQLLRGIQSIKDTVLLTISKH